MIFSRVVSLLIDLIRPLNFTPNDLCATSDKNTNFNISKICYVKSGFQILYAVKFTIFKVTFAYAIELSSNYFS